MRPLSDILNEVESYLDERSKKPDKDYKARATHFRKLKRLINEKEYAELMQHVDNGISAFQKTSLFKQKYQDYLFQIKEYFLSNPILEPNNAYTLLHYAIEQKHTDLALLLIEVTTTAEINLKTTSGQSPLSLAVKTGNLKIVSKLIERHAEIDKDLYKMARKLARSNSESFIEVYKLIRKPFRDYKYKIINKGSVAANLNKEELDSYMAPIQAIATQLYLEDPSQGKNILNKLQILYSSPSDILKPLIELIAVFSSEKYSNLVNQEKLLKTLISQQVHLGNLRPSASTKKGQYTQKNTVFISANFETILHEWKHFADKILFGSTRTSFRNEDKTRFNAVSKLIRNKMAQQEVYLLPQKRAPWEILDTVFIIYPKKKWGIELMARVPQILGLLGIEKGLDWLDENVPNLLESYQDWNQVCRDYLEKIQVKEQKISIFKTSLGLYASPHKASINDDKHLKNTKKTVHKSS